jgi:hypothetical protein
MAENPGLRDPLHGRTRAPARCVLEAAQRHAASHARRRGRLIHALRPYVDRSTSVGEAMRSAAQDLGIEQDGRSFEEFAGLVVAAAEARHGAAAG